MNKLLRMPQKTKSLIRLSVFTVRAEFSNFHFLFGEEASRTIFSCNERRIELRITKCPTGECKN